MKMVFVCTYIHTHYNIALDTRIGPLNLYKFIHVSKHQENQCQRYTTMLPKPQVGKLAWFQLIFSDHFHNPKLIFSYIQINKTWSDETCIREGLTELDISI